MKDFGSLPTWQRCLLLLHPRNSPQKSPDSSSNTFQRNFVLQEREKEKRCFILRKQARIAKRWACVTMEAAAGATDIPLGLDVSREDGRRRRDFSRAITKLWSRSRSRPTQRATTKKCLGYSRSRFREQLVTPNPNASQHRKRNLL